MKTITLRAGMDRRFRSGHPWVYSNELAQSPKGLEPGEPVELRDAGGKFLARGYGNPASLITFRALSRDPEVAEPLSLEQLTQTLRQAAEARFAAGLRDVSFRLCFGEADRLPGLVIDRFVVGEKGGVDAAQVFVLQAHTAGMDRVVPQLVQALETLTPSLGRIPWARTAVVVRNDMNVRKLEGIAVEEPRLLKSVEGLNLSDVTILVRSASDEHSVEFSADLGTGQKTGFFLDQAANVRLACSYLKGLRPEQGDTIRIVDLCCYVGQWSAQLSRMFVAQGLKVHVIAVDASAEALAFAKRNIERQGARCEILKADVLKDEDVIAQAVGKADLVISDPPALIKGRKDIHAGTHAYLQLNTLAMQMVRRGGGLVTCSCSALLPEDDFTRALSKAAYRNRRLVRWLARGTQGPDHPMSTEFPEGRYLKAWLGVVS